MLSQDSHPGLLTQQPVLVTLYGHHSIVESGPRAQESCLSLLPMSESPRELFTKSEAWAPTLEIQNPLVWGEVWVSECFIQVIWKTTESRRSLRFTWHWCFRHLWSSSLVPTKECSGKAGRTPPQEGGRADVVRCQPVLGLARLWTKKTTARKAYLEHGTLVLRTITTSLNFMAISADCGAS